MVITLDQQDYTISAENEEAALPSHNVIAVINVAQTAVDILTQRTDASIQTPYTAAQLYEMFNFDKSLARYYGLTDRYLSEPCYVSTDEPELYTDEQAHIRDIKLRAGEAVTQDRGIIDQVDRVPSLMSEVWKAFNTTDLSAESIIKALELVNTLRDGIFLPQFIQDGYMTTQVYGFFEGYLSIPNIAEIIPGNLYEDLMSYIEENKPRFGLSHISQHPKAHDLMTSRRDNRTLNDPMLDPRNMPSIFIEYLRDREDKSRAINQTIRMKYALRLKHEALAEGINNHKLQINTERLSPLSRPETGGRKATHGKLHTYNDGNKEYEI
jgi:hypothetical protein